MPDELLQKIAPHIARWLEAVSECLNGEVPVFLELCERVLEAPVEDRTDDDHPVTRAINHPVGYVARALLNLWFKRKPNDGDRLPDDLKPLFTRICNRDVVRFRHGRVLLASRVIAFLRVDRPWSETHLLPLFDWAADPAEARAVWEGFLWSPRLYQPLLIALKNALLDTCHHYGELGNHAQQFAAFLTYAALDPAETYTTDDFQNALGSLPQEGLETAAHALVQALEGAGEQREDYWTNRIQPFWQSVWPKSLQLISNDLAESLAQLCIAARGQFPAAVNLVYEWLQPIDYPHFVIHLLEESGLSARFPEEAIRFLGAVIENQPWAPEELGKCLAAISEAAPAFLDDPRYLRLMVYLRQHEN